MFKITLMVLLSISTIQCIVSTGTCTLKVGGVCLQCSDETYLSQNQQCLGFSPIVDCLLYDETQLPTSVCYSCNQNKVFYSGSCQSIDFCLSYNTNGDSLLCTECEEGYYPTGDSKICLPIIDHCNTYDSSTTKESTYLLCSECNPNFELSINSQVCYLKINKCTTHGYNSSSGAVTCNSCQEGWRLSSDSLKCLNNITNCDTYGKTRDRKSVV
jgi:hypothetical protein